MRDRFIQIAANSAALIFFAAAIGCGRGKYPKTQLILLIGALPLSAIGAVHGCLADKKLPYQRMIEAAKLESYAEKLAIAITGKDRITTPPISAQPQQPDILPPASTSGGEQKSAEQKPPQIIPLQSILDTGTGIIIMGNSGAGKSSVVLWLIGEVQPSNLIIIDPHNDGKTWGSMPVVDDYDAILAKLKEILDELKRRRERRKMGLDNSLLMIAIDEWPSIRAYARQMKNDICDQFIILMGCEARKLKMISLLCSQSGNVRSFGLDGQGDFLENWCLVRLGKTAKKYAKTMPDRSIAEVIMNTAYPCLIGDELSIHPTHGHYSIFANNQPPRNIKPYCPPQHRALDDLQEKHDQAQEIDIPEDMIAQFSALKAAGKNKADIILELWGAKRGSKAYLAASDKYEQIKNFLASSNQQ